jgi:enamine deaminase RidA (YjgF/YER057c/UK114 family)
MPKEIISTPEAPQSPMYSQAVKAGNTIYVAGTTGVDVTTGEFAGATVKEQAPPVAAQLPGDPACRWSRAERRRHGPHPAYAP